MITNYRGAVLVTLLSSGHDASKNNRSQFEAIEVDPGKEEEIIITAKPRYKNRLLSLAVVNFAALHTLI